MNRMTLTLLRGFVVLALFLACPASARSADPMIMGVAGPAINMVYSFVARDAGLFKKYGLDARVVVFDAGSILAQAALSGQVKISVSSGPATIAARTQGADTTIIAACVNTLPLQHRRRQRNNHVGAAQRKENSDQPIRLGNGHRHPVSPQKIQPRSR
jgi:ABC-type nitrate/sulfonate/bicarbonate transport system substrate-binding protein